MWEMQERRLPLPQAIRTVHAKTDLLTENFPLQEIQKGENFFFILTESCNVIGVLAYWLLAIRSNPDFYST